MCTISVDTIRRANERLIRSRKAGACPSPSRRLGDDIVVSTTYNGQRFEQRITKEQVREAFVQARKATAI